ncbi:MAG TPA: hypothetical protein VGE85_11395 [Terracidiphilus sp.]|jgi:hypothetical protein
MSERRILLGYELGSGIPVRIPAAHMVVTGITQMSGKTTTLEALVARLGLRAVAFVTKRGEGCFGEAATAARIPAYFDQRADWQSAEERIEEYLGEPLPKSYRPHLMRACENAKTLTEVLKTLDKMQDEGSGQEASAGYVLGSYLRSLLAQFADEAESQSGLQLHAGLNVIDLSRYSLALQSIAIASAIDWICERELNIVTLVPEAWEFLPRVGRTPAKSAAIRLARKGACCGNYLWVDSQDLASIDPEIRKACTVYLLGVQREANEVRRTLTHIPKDRRRPSERELMQLGRGWFYCSYERELACVYVQPTWLDSDPARAQRYASEILPASYVAKGKTNVRVKKVSGRAKIKAGALSEHAASKPQTERVQ